MTPVTNKIANDMVGIIEEVADYKNYENSIGYSFRFFSTEMVKNNQIKLLSINGIVPDKINIINKSYPYITELYCVTAGSKNPNVDKFINWILSEQGQELVEKTGYVKLRN